MLKFVKFEGKKRVLFHRAQGRVGHEKATCLDLDSRPEVPQALRLTRNDVTRQYGTSLESGRSQASVENGVVESQFFGETWRKRQYLLKQAAVSALHPLSHTHTLSRAL